MFPDLSQDLDFDILASMVTGTAVPPTFGGAEVISSSTNDLTPSTSNKVSFQMAAGIALTAWGAMMLVPGPGDMIAFSVGAYIGGPIGGVVGLALYNVFALLVLGTGLFLIYTA